MGLNILSLRKLAQVDEYVSGVQLCVSADDELVECTDTRAVRLLVAAGSSIPTALAAKYGLIAPAEQPQDEAATGKPAPPNKARKRAPQNK